jgi:uncharacterized protein YjiS (DUF1127 family)
MMDERVQLRDYRLYSLDRRGDQRRAAARLPGTDRASSVLTMDYAAQRGWHLWTSPDLLLAGRERHRAETRHIVPLTAIRRVVAAIRRWREHTRSRQQLRALDDHMLQDIGLKREDVGFEFPKPLWHWD